MLITSNRPHCQGRLKLGLCGNELKETPGMQGDRNNQHFLLFPQSILPFITSLSIFELHFAICKIKTFNFKSSLLLFGKE